MEEMEDSGSSVSNYNDLLSQHRRLNSPSPNPLQLPNFTAATAAAPQSRFPFQYFSHEASAGLGAGKRSGIPPIPPSPSSRSPSPASAVVNPFHSRSLSQPTFFSLDSLPMELSMDDSKGATFSVRSPAPMIPRTQGSVGVGDRGPGESLPPRKGHRRSQSGDFPFSLMQQPTLSAAAARPPLVKQEVVSVGDGSSDRKPEVDAEDDLISQYMNLDSLDALNSSGTEEKHDDLDSSKLSGTKVNTTESSENEAESSVNESVGCGGSEEKRGRGNKRSSADDIGSVNSRHMRSLSMDSMMRKMHFGDELPKLLPSPSNPISQLLRTESMDRATMNPFGLDMGNGEFSNAEMKKIMANEKLAEMALTDPKRVKRILANRQSAARSKERKMRYISELEHKVQTLQTEATTLSAQLTLLQRDSTGLTNQNNELRFCLQAMEQQANIREALNEALTAEVRRLKLATGETTDAQLSKNLNQQMQINSQMFHLQPMQVQQQNSGSTPLYQFQSIQRQQFQEKQQHKQADASPKSEQTKE